MTAITNAARATVAAALAAALAAGSASVAFAAPATTTPAAPEPAVVAQSDLIGEGAAYERACCYSNTSFCDVVDYTSTLTWDCSGYPIYVVQMWRTYDTSWNTFEVDGYTGAVLSWY